MVEGLLECFSILEEHPDSEVHFETLLEDFPVFSEGLLVAGKVSGLLVVVPLKKDPQLGGKEGVLRSVGEEQSPSLVH